jgi:transposase
MSDALAKRLVTDDLWQVLEPLIPPARIRPQGGGRNRADDRAVFTAVTFVLTTGCPWRALPRVFGVKPATVHRRFGEWMALRLWERLHEQAVATFGTGPEVDWTRALVELTGARTGDDAMLNTAPCPTPEPAVGAGVVISIRSGSSQPPLMGSSCSAVPPGVGPLASRRNDDFAMTERVRTARGTGGRGCRTLSRHADDA